MSGVHISCATGFPPVDPDWMCCTGAAFTDGERCTCWVKITDRPRTLDVAAGPMPVRTEMCHDCAFRPGSPERAEQGGRPIEAVPGQQFTCHQGMPVVLGYTSFWWVEPDGSWREGAISLVSSLLGDRESFEPVTRGDMAWQADGAPAGRCAGWAAATKMRPGDRAKRVDAER